jgi:transposase
VPAERVSMRKTHEVLRLHFDLKLKQRQIARSVNLSQSTVHEYLHRFTAAGLSWPLPEQTSEAELEAALFSADAKPPRAPARNLPDFSHIHKELQEHKHVTLQLLWEEYIATHPDGYRYSTNKYRPVNRSKASGNTVESPTLEVSFSCTRENDKNR